MATIVLTAFIAFVIIMDFLTKQSEKFEHKEAVIILIVFALAFNLLTGLVGSTPIGTETKQEQKEIMLLDEYINVDGVSYDAAIYGGCVHVDGESYLIDDIELIFLDAAPSYLTISETRVYEKVGFICGLDGFQIGNLILKITGESKEEVKLYINKNKVWSEK